jgi:DNA-binding GntR family transcriptional regulator
MTNGDFIRLRSICAQMERYAEPVIFGVLNRRLHPKFTARCGSAYLLQLPEQTSNRLDRIRPTMSAYLPERTATAALEHACLLELLGNADAAEVERYAR